MSGQLETVRNSIAVADPQVPANVLKPNADGSLNINAIGLPAGTVLQFADINIAASGAVVAAVAGKRIRVIAMDIVCPNAQTVSWQSSGGAEISGPQAFAANGGIVRPYNPGGWFQTAIGEGLNIIVSGAGTIGGNVTFITV